MKQSELSKLDELITDFDSSKPVKENPALEFFADMIAGDWGGSIQQSREILMIVYRLGKNSTKS